MVASYTLDPETDILPLASDDDSDTGDLEEGAGDTQATAPTDTDSAKRLKELEKQLADAKQWEARFKGIQPVVQRNAEEAKRLKAEKDAMEVQLAQLRISLLPEEQQQPAYTTYQQAVALRTSEEQRRAESAVMEEVLRVAVINQISTQYGVPREDLEDFTDPHSAEKYAKKVSELRTSTAKTVKKQARKESEADTFESSGSVSIPLKQPETMAEADALFASKLRALQRGRR